MRRAILFATSAVALVALAGSGRIQGQGPTALEVGMLPTAERPGARYLGQQACAGCHGKQTASYREAGMGHAAQRIEDCAVLAARPLLTFESGRYRYRIERRGRQSLYEVSDGETTISVPIGWCFGHGEAGQTWIFERDGVLHESRVSYYAKGDGLDFTLGAPPGPPRNLSEAVGRPMTPDDVRGCFGCHTTFSARGSEMQVDKALPGVTCEGCHGPGGDHPAALGRGDTQDRGIFNPGRLPTEAMSNFCGNCHRSWEQVMLAGIQGVANVRFQPYRLANSRCYDTEDPRIRCTACHDPHVPRKEHARTYDAACLACHDATKAAVGPRVTKPCPRASENCSSCHMPRYEIPGSHFESTDHQIRVVRPGELYPN
jgi:hypothetical protein